MLVIPKFHTNSLTMKLIFNIQFFNGTWWAKFHQQQLSWCPLSQRRKITLVIYFWSSWGLFINLKKKYLKINTVNFLCDKTIYRIQIKKYSWHIGRWMTFKMQEFSIYIQMCYINNTIWMQNIFNCIRCITLYSVEQITHIKMSL